MIKELSVINEISKLKGNGSQKLKETLLNQNFTDKMEYILSVCFDPFITTKLNKISTTKESVDIESVLLFQHFYTLIEDLKVAPAANNELRERASKLLNYRLSENDNENEELRKLLYKIVTKSMNIGLGAKLINKAVGRDIIPDPSLMLASDDQTRMKNWSKIYCEEKYDGVRVIAMYKDDKISYFTRAFNEIPSYYLEKITTEIKSCLLKSGIVGDWFLDGELTDLTRQSVSGKVTSMLRDTADINIGDDMLYNIFDLEELSTLETGVGVISYLDRRNALSNILKYSFSEDSHIILARMWELDNLAEIDKVYKEIIALGGEGVICKENTVYSCKRSNSWIKFKEVKDCDLEITGIFDGENKRADMGWIGGFVCESECRGLKVKVGSGFSDSLLEEIKEDPSSYIGRIVKVKYNVIINDKKMNYSLFLPRLEEIRPDKHIADTLERIKKI